MRFMSKGRVEAISKSAVNKEADVYCNSFIKVVLKNRCALMMATLNTSARQINIK